MTMSVAEVIAKPCTVLWKKTGAPYDFTVNQVADNSKWETSTSELTKISNVNFIVNDSNIKKIKMEKNSRSYRQW